MPTAVVVGGGYAGVCSARLLAKSLGKSWSIRLITRSACHELTTRLPEVASGRVNSDLACIPYERIIPRRVEVSYGEIVSVSPEKRLVQTREGSVVEADALLLTTGSRVDFLDVAGAPDYALPLKTLDDASHLHAVFHGLPSGPVAPCVAIVGAGYTGTELCGELTAGFRENVGGTSRVTLIDENKRLMPDGNPRLAQLATRRLQLRGVQFRLGQPVETVDKDRVILVNGEEIPSDVSVWAAHSVAAIPGKANAWQTGRDDRIRVDPFLRAIGYAGIYVAGDCALGYDYRRDAPVPSNAQLALQEATIAANNLAADHGSGRLREFVPRMIGEAVSLGAGDCVAELGGVTVTGRFATAVKRAALVHYLSGFGDASLLRDYA